MAATTPLAIRSRWIAMSRYMGEAARWRHTVTSSHLIIYFKPYFSLSYTTVNETLIMCLITALQDPVVLQCVIASLRTVQSYSGVIQT